MVVDGASSHTSMQLVVPANMSLLQLPPYNPELNPSENAWEMLRERLFPNWVYATIEEIKKQLQERLPKFAADTGRLQSIAGHAWIINAISTAS